MFSTKKPIISWHENLKIIKKYDEFYRTFKGLNLGIEKKIQEIFESIDDKKEKS